MFDRTGNDAASSRDNSGFRAPAIDLPKGGGAIRGVGEKFAANPVTGTGSLGVPIAISPGRAGFNPQLSLSYDSGAGNGVFGFGWSLGLPQISRKTDKGLPRYDDAFESDVFILSGAEDLVPLYRRDPDGTWITGHRGYQRDPVEFWVRDASGRMLVYEDEMDGYYVRRYRPRIEGLFARIERWSKIGQPSDVHWRSISKDNILTLYGCDANSRIADPLDASRIFSWLICETRDDKGNAVLYRYKAEDGQGVDLGKAHERNRGSQNDSRRTVNRYLKRIYYGNRTPLLDNAGNRLRFLDKVQIDSQITNSEWMFEVVFDYDDHDSASPEPRDDEAEDAAGALKYPWKPRLDPFSTYRPGFEVRTTRLCQRVLMFHHFPGIEQSGVGANCLVRSTDFTYSHEVDPTDVRNPIYTFLRAVTQAGYRRRDGGYGRRTMPPVEFHYTLPEVADRVVEVDSGSLESLPVGVDGTSWEWADLYGEGLQGSLAEQAEAWFYKRNLSPLADKTVALAPPERVATKPASSLASGARLIDLAGDGQPDLVVLDGPTRGFYEHDDKRGWKPFRPFTSHLERDSRDANLRFVDLDGDGHADVLISEDEAFVWHASLGEEGFGPARRVAQALDEENGPRVDLAEARQSIYLADMCGDGLTDLVRIRNGEVCYWPNLGYGRFGAKITMDNAPLFDHPDLFDNRRIQLADIDGTGTADIIYLHPEGVRLYFNQSGNRWSTPHRLAACPRADDVVTTVDLFGNGTACLVLSSPRPGDAGRAMRYIDLMGGVKPHLLIKMVNNLGAETRVHYAPSTRFYLQDERDGRPWITRLPFPVHVVDQVEVYDYISRNRFTTRYAYHHGFFDGVEREFRGFGMVEQWDTEEFGALAEGAELPTTNLDAASQLPPVHTKTWFHTGVFIGRNHVSDFFAGFLDTDDGGEYFREPDLSDTEAQKLLLPDTELPAGLVPEEQRQACRALKGSMLRREVYALDGATESTTPYVVTEQNFTVHRLQPQGENRHAVFFAHPRETITYHYERNPADPRIQHALTLEVDQFGNVLKEAAIGYGRRERIRILDPEGEVGWIANPALAALEPRDRDKQTRILVTYTDNAFTNAINEPDDYRTPLACETRTFELTGIEPGQEGGRFSFLEWARNGFKLTASAEGIPYEATADGTRPERRPIEHVRTLFRPDDLGAAGDPSALLPLGTVGHMAFAGETLKLAFTPGLISEVFQRQGQQLLPNPADILGGTAGDQGGYRSSDELKAAGAFPATDPGRHWWIPAGRTFLSPGADDDPAQELAYARAHFFLPHRFRDPFGSTSTVSYDDHDLLILETRDALGNRVTVGERDPAGNLVRHGNDYRVLQPQISMDANRNRAAVAFDALGMVVGTAVMGKPEETLGDSLDGFAADLPEATILAHMADPLVDPHTILNRATSRLVYDLFAYHRSKDQPEPQPAVVYTLVREKHDADLADGERTRIQHSFSYSDGFGREIQQKIQAEPEMIDGVDGPPRWVGSGWTIFNNKGKPVRQYEPFFSELAPPESHRFEFARIAGVSRVLFYDPVERVVATLHPNDTYEKVVFDPWQQTTWDVNDTVLADPRSDEDIRGYTAAYFAARAADPTEPAFETWHARRQGERLGVEEQAAATKAAGHANTPTTAHFDTLGRPFLTVARNRVVCTGHDLDGTEAEFRTRVELDIEGNERAVIDADDRVVMRYAYDMLGNRIHQASMEASERWTLSDVAGQPIRAWDSRGHTFRTEYDSLRRPRRSFVMGADRNDVAREMLTQRLVYGDQHPEAQARNLRGALYLHLDQAGAAATEARDFKGNVLTATRRIAVEYKEAIDWAVADAALPVDGMTAFVPDALEAALSPLLESETFTSRTAYDALNRPSAVTTPHTPAMQPSIVRPGYNEANLLERLDVNLRGARSAGEPVWTPFVTDIDYDTKGQRERIEYGNKVTTTYTYDPLTYRLIRLETHRDKNDFPNDCPAEREQDWPGCGVQDLNYTYDPAGNITGIRDDAQQAIFFRNGRVEPSADYTYDAVYRLIQATGREHLGQGGQPIPHSYDDALRSRLAHPGDGGAMGIYTERYVYDAVGNFERMQHHLTEDSARTWTRSYDYDEPSLLEPGKFSNRLSQTTVGNRDPITERYVHDADGNMIRMPHLGGAHPGANMRWDHRDQLSEVDLGGGGRVFYTYDAAGQRVRKVWEKSPNLVEERIYLAGFEIFRRRQNGQRLERETLHVMDDKRRVALVETRTRGNDPAPARFTRYQLGNHLGSSSLELDDQAQIVSYEEYSPYGSTTYQAVHSQTETQKRYQYTGKERDEGTGFLYHGARYLMPWIGRWISTDPAGIADGTNSFRYVATNPVRFLDPDGLQYDPNWEYEEWMPLLRLYGATVEFLFGGRARPSESNEIELPEGGVGGAVGGAADTLTFRQTGVLEDYPTEISRQGMDFGADQVPILGPAENLFFNETVSGAPIDPREELAWLAFDIVSFGLMAAEARAARLEGRGLRFARAVSPGRPRPPRVSRASEAGRPRTTPSASGPRRTRRLLPEYSATTERQAASLMAEHPGLTRRNALDALQGPEGATALIKGQGGQGADIVLRRGHVALRREVTVWQGGSQGSFNRKIGYAARRQLRYYGEIRVQVPAGTTRQQFEQRLGRFYGSRPTDAQRGQLRSVSITAVDPEGRVVYSGPLVR